MKQFKTSLGAMGWLSNNSKPKQSLDIKWKLGNAKGYLLNGKYVTGEGIGNYLFGMNLESLRQFGAVAGSIISPIGNKENTFDMAAAQFGIFIILQITWIILLKDPTMVKYLQMIKAWLIYLLVKTCVRCQSLTHLSQVNQFMKSDAVRRIQ